MMEGCLARVGVGATRRRAFETRFYTIRVARHYVSHAIVRGARAFETRAAALHPSAPAAHPRP